MKRTMKIFTMLIAVSLIFISCEKVTTDNVSRETNYPILTLNGDVFLTINLGDTWTDPGATASIGSSVTPVDGVGTVDLNTTGVYRINYTAFNSDGYSASASRWVGVIDVAAAGNDFTGDYQRTKYGTNTTPAGIANWTKIMDGLYTTNNVGGVPDNPPFIYDVYIFNVEGNEIIVPSQPNALGGEVYCVNGSEGERITFVPGPAGTESVEWGVRGSGYGTNPRTFTKL